jgi:hypothetical protein
MGDDMSVVKRARKKSVEVDTMVWDGTAQGTAAVLEWMAKDDATAMWSGGDWLSIYTLEGVIDASVGDVIIRGVEREFYPCKPGIYAKTYDEVDGEVA